MEWQAEKKVVLKRKQFIFACVVFAILFLGFILMIKPTIQGYQVSSQIESIGANTSDILKEVESYKVKIASADSSLTACKSLNEDHIRSIAASKSTADYCAETSRKTTLDLTSCTSDVAREKTASAQCQNRTATLVSDNSGLTLNLARVKVEYEGNMSRLKTDYDASINRLLLEQQFNASRVITELNSLKVEYDKYRQTHAAIVQWAADNICCKNKIDNPKIDSYVISEDRMVCTSGAPNKLKLCA